MIREAHANDIPAIVEIHMTALPSDFLPRMGNRFLRKVFYPAVLNSSNALTIVQEEFGRIESFVVFAYDSRKLTRDARGNLAVLAVYTLAALIRDITLISELMSHVRGFRAELHTEIDICLSEIPELYVMATAPERQSSGLGGALLDKGLEILRPVHSACLVRTSSQQARHFYEKHRFRDIGVEYRTTRRVHLLLHDGLPALRQ